MKRLKIIICIFYGETNKKISHELCSMLAIAMGLEIRKVVGLGMETLRGSVFNAVNLLFSQYLGCPTWTFLFLQ